MTECCFFLLLSQIDVIHIAMNLNEMHLVSVKPEELLLKIISAYWQQMGFFVCALILLSPSFHLTSSFYRTNRHILPKETYHRSKMLERIKRRRSRLNDKSNLCDRILIV